MIERSDWWDLLNRPALNDAVSVALLGLPYDGGVSYRRGAAAAPARLRELSRTSSAITETGREIGCLRLFDWGDLQPVSEGTTAPHRYFEQVELFLAQQSLPSLIIALGGDHSTIIPVARGVRSRGQRTWGVIHIDAHPDLFSVYEKSPYSHACALRRILELPEFHPKRCALVGVRSFSSFETDFIRTAGMMAFTARDLQARGSTEVLKELCGRFQEVDTIFVSLDIDAADPAFAPGTGIPVAGGLSSRDLLSLVEGIFMNLPVSVFSLVEIAPPLDVSDITSFLGIQLILEVLGHAEQRLHR